MYLEELTDVVPEADTTTQTDAFLDRPPTPQFVPTKLGTDAATQVEQGESMVGSGGHQQPCWHLETAVAFSTCTW